MPMALTEALISSLTFGMTRESAATTAAIAPRSSVPAAGVPYFGWMRVQTGPTVRSRPMANSPRTVGITPACSEATAEKVSATRGSAASGWWASWLPK